MFDARLRPFIDPLIQPLANGLARGGVSANMLTLSALLPAAAAFCFILQGNFWLAAICIILNRLLDGLDGLVARINGPTALGGYLDIVADFIFYVSIPVAFGLANPANLEPALILVAAFTITGISFLAFASVAANHEIPANAPDSELGAKGFLYTTGIMEGGETIAFFIAFCLLPAWFGLLALVFAGLCVLTVLQRSWLAARRL